MARLGFGLKRVLRTLRFSKVHRAIAKDLAETHASASFLRTEDSGATETQIALVPIIGGKPYDCKLMAMLAVGLRLAGWRIRVLLIRRRNIQTRLYLEAFGFTDFIYWEDYHLTPEERSLCSSEAKKFFGKELSFGTVKEWHYRDCWIGPNILASVSRERHAGAPDPANPKVERRLREILPESLETIHVAEKIIDEIRPKLMYLIEPNYSKNGPITDVAIKSGVDFIHTVGCPRDDALMMRRLSLGNRRAHPSAITPENLRSLCEEPWAEREEARLNDTFQDRYSGKWVVQSFNQQGTRPFERDTIFKTLELESSRKLAVVFSHVLWDANLFYGSDLFEDYGHWFTETVKAAIDNDALNWIIKLHPANSWKMKRDGKAEEKLAELSLIERLLGPDKKLPDHVRLMLPTSNISAWSLYEVTDFGVTVRGTVSTELPCLGKPVFTAGTGRAHGHGFTIDSSSRQEYLDRMASIHTTPPLSEEEIMLAKRHAHAIFVRRPWIMKSFRPDYGDYSNAANPLALNLHLAARSLEEINSNGDLRLWAEWAADPDKVDYLRPKGS